MPLAASGALFLVLLFFAPGFGVQYLDWPLALLPFALSWRTAIGLNATMSLFLFITYTVWCDGWPWWYADLAVPHQYLWLVTASGLVTWLAIGFGAVHAVLRLRALFLHRDPPTQIPR